MIIQIKLTIPCLKMLAVLNFIKQAVNYYTAKGCKRRGFYQSNSTHKCIQYVKMAFLGGVVQGLTDGEGSPLA
jgi:hypothetical protein